MNKIEKMKSESGAKMFASVMGKSTIASSNEEYKSINQIIEVLLKNNFGVIHGGYTGGAMQAVSDTATTYIKENKLSALLNIGVPQKQHDGLWERVSEAFLQK